MCLRGSRGDLKPLPGVCRQDSKLHAAQQDALGHRTVAFDCSDSSVLFICTKCKCHSSGASVRGLGGICKPSPSRAARYGWKALEKGNHPHYSESKHGVTVDTGRLMQCFNTFAPEEAASGPASCSRELGRQAEPGDQLARVRRQLPPEEEAVRSSAAAPGGSLGACAGEPGDQAELVDPLSQLRRRQIDEEEEDAIQFLSEGSD